MKDGSAAGVSGTPAMFINGRFVSGAVPLEQITPLIDDELRRKGVQTAANSSSAVQHGFEEGRSGDRPFAFL